MIIGIFFFFVTHIATTISVLCSIYLFIYYRFYREHASECAYMLVIIILIINTEYWNEETLINLYDSIADTRTA